MKTVTSRVKTVNAFVEPEPKDAPHLSKLGAIMPVDRGADMRI
ncbi:hypothetical protein [Teredinibacter turnerae]|uniref:Uncharacterized protein n=1 Tax=Teredinibacter turnerae (strain ATCC 39867 / T7901) TaxID=377629 RepID=C5BPI6_TERTT|nr:hypothetical protein [Teredinibacter turnerae]ACR12298.1 hypothetical protein TERTU_0801 [Teredinibacter turnerae T7901]